MGCKINFTVKINDSKLYQVLLNTWQNGTKAFETFAHVATEEGFTPEFLDWYYKKHNIDVTQLTDSKHIDTSNVSLPNLPNTTKTENVEISSNILKEYESWLKLNPTGIVAYRINKQLYTTPEYIRKRIIGNPFSEVSQKEETVDAFYKWLLTGDNVFEGKVYNKATNILREEILHKLVSIPEGSKILYYEELNRPSHANIIEYFINNKNVIKEALLINNFNYNTKLTLDNFDESTIYKDITEFISEYAKIDATKFTPNLRSNKASDYNYYSDSDREWGLHWLVDLVNRIYTNQKYNKQDNTKHGKFYYMDAAVDDYFNNIISNILEIYNITKEDFISRVSDKTLLNLKYKYYLNDCGETQALAKKYAVLAAKLNVLEEIVNSQSDKFTYAIQNQIALAKEMIDSSYVEGTTRRKRQALFDEVFNYNPIPELGNLEDYYDKREKNAEANLAGQSTEDYDITTDESIKLFDHSGVYKDVSEHVDVEIKLFLDSVPKLISSEKLGDRYQADKNNPFGLRDNIGHKACEMVLYSDTDKMSMPKFLESIKRIAESRDGYEGFIYLYDELSKNADLLYEFYTIFGKERIDKTQIVVNTDGTTEHKISNKKSDRNSVVIANFARSTKNAAINLNHISINESLDKIATQIKNAKNDSELSKIIYPLYDLMTIYYPSISKSGFVNFIRKNVEGINKNISQEEITKSNLVLVGNLLRSTINGAIKTSNNFNQILEKVREDYRYNNLLREARLNGDSSVANRKFANPSDNWKEPYIDSSLTAAYTNVAKYFADSVSALLDYNSSNAEHKPSSDIINSNMITVLKKVLNDPNFKDVDSALRHYAEYKFQIRRENGVATHKLKQYDFSNILLEQTIGDINPNADESIQDRIVNYGLFKYNPINETYEPTPYANELLKYDLFDGTDNKKNDKQALYSKMPKLDYKYSSFIAFIDEKFTSANLPGARFASYFLRTPSDAPKNFKVRAPRYSSTELFQYDVNILNTSVNNILVDLFVSQSDKVYSDSKIKQIFNLSVEDAANIILGTYKKDIFLPTNSKVKFNQCVLNINGTKIIVEGNLNQKGNLLSNVRFVSFLDTKSVNDINIDLSNSIKKKLSEDIIRGKRPINNETGEKLKVTINRNSQLYNQFYSIIFQEITDCYNALKTLFTEQVNKNNNDIKTFYDPKTRTVEWNENFVGEDEQTFQVYHRKKNKVIENGKLTGRVFHSDRFSFFDENKIDEASGQLGAISNVFADFFSDEVAKSEDGLIHFLYGGTEEAENAGLHVKEYGDIYLTPAQQAYLHNKLEEFINTFTASEVQRFEESSHLFDESIDTSYENKCDYVLNYFLMNVNSDALLEGDSKYYVDETNDKGIKKDMFKRMKQSQASGVPYGLCDFTRALGGQKEEVQISKLNEPKTQERLAKIGITNCKQYTGFNAITIANTRRTSKSTQTIIKDKLTESLINNYVREHGTIEDTKKEELAKKANTIMSYYKDLKVNDAQSYITLEEWIRRVAARGQLNRYLPLIEKIQDTTKDITIDDLEEFVQVQKNFYYDQYYDENTNTMSGRQIKNSEFVLIPRFIQGTELESLYNVMKRYDIDQINTVETSKAGKANILTLWDNDGVFHDNFDNAPDEIIKQATQFFDYNFLYTQQETPQHMNEENKFGLQIAKRSIDNIDEGHPLYPLKLEYFEVYTSKINASHTKLADRLNLSLDKDGNILFDGEQIKNLDYSVFVKMMKEQLQRQGLDSNTIDCVTLDDSGLTINGEFGVNTKIPIWANNNNRRKLESVAQSIFNNAITRQKLPGFHAAQITGIGWKFDKNNVTYKLKSDIKSDKLKKELSKEEYNNLNEEDKEKYIQFNGNVGRSSDLRYHEDENGNYVPYIEVLVPKSVYNFNRKKANGKLKSDEELLKELKKEGLDKIVGYRIPTEGKYSVAVMKIAGFIDDSYGSTIIVPDDWVGQTGSDFDIDSIYAITHHTSIDKYTKKIKRILYKHSGFDRKDWIKYINSRADNIESESIKEKVEELRNTINEQNATNFADWMNQANDNWNELSKDIQKSIKAAHEASEEANKEEENKNIKFIKQNEDEINTLKTLLESVKSEEISAIENRIEILTNFNEFLKEEGQTKEKLKEEKEKAEEERYKAIENICKELNLPTYEEYQNMSIADKNYPKAKDNRLTEIIIEIISSETSMEENLTPSRFNDIIDGINKYISAYNRRKKAGRSVYSINDQADNQEDAMAGASLKGISVYWDNFISTCNTVKPVLTDGFEVVYHDKTKTQIELEKKFGEGNVRGKKGAYIVTHKFMGWSLDGNKNIDDEYITTYGAQTTAHQLDAIKEGSVPNVNEYTFPVYKMITACGSNFNTAIAFIMQPAVKRIFDAYNRKNSVYIENYSNPINVALKEVIALIKENTDLLNNININDLKEVKKVLSKYIKNIIVLDEKELANRIENTDSELDTNVLLRDYATILQFQDLHMQAGAISPIMDVCNPDKYGAKATIFETNQIIEKIKEIHRAKYQVFMPKHDKNGESINIMSSIFPGSEQLYKGLTYYLNNSNNEDSSYKTLNTFLKRATITSILLNRNVFPTQHYNFRKIVDDLKDYINKAIDVDINFDFESYIINNLFTNLQIIKHNIGFNVDTNTIELTDSDSFEERNRIYGFGKSNVVLIKRTKVIGDEEKEIYEGYEPSSIVSPSQEDINEFLKFSPAQKVDFIKQYFKNAFVVDYLDVDLAATKIGSNFHNGQTIRVKEGQVSEEKAFEDFKNMFNSDNPYLKLTAIDLIKYAYVVEGRSFRTGNISKIIDNDVILNELNQGGLGLISQAKQKMNNIISEKAEITEDLYLNYIRSHSDSLVNSCWINSTDKQKYFSTVGFDILVANCLDNQTEQFLINKGILLEDSEGTKTPAKFIVINDNNESTLYKIENTDDYKKYVLIPLNKLEENENDAFSCNDDNNKFYEYNVYKQLLEDYKRERDRYYADEIVVSDEVVKTTFDTNNEQLNALINEIKTKNPGILFIRHTDEKTLKGDVDFQRIFDDPNNQTINKFKQEIDDNFANNNQLPLYTINRAVYNNIQGFGNKNGVLINYKSKIYKITKINNETIFDLLDHSKTNEERENKFKELNVNSVYKKFLNNLYKQNLTNPNICMVRPVTLRYADVEESIERETSNDFNEETQRFVSDTKSTFDKINTVSRNEDNKDASEFVLQSRLDRIDFNTTSIGNNLVTATFNNSGYVKRTVEQLLNDLNSFTIDPDTGLTLRMTDDKVFGLLLNNPTLARRYLKTMLDINRLINYYESYKSYKLEDLPEEIRDYVSEILKNIEILEKNDIYKQSEKLYLTKYLAKFSNNPNIKDNLISLLDGYHKVGYLTSYVNDLQDSSNPIVQLITHRVMGDIYAKQFQAKQLRENFLKQISDLEKEAKSKGLSINWDNFVDENGVFKQIFNKQFEKDFEDLTNAKKDAYEAYRRTDKTGYEKAKLYNEYLKTKYKYDKFLLKHINREIEDSYYKLNLDLDKEFIDDNGNFMPIFIEYKMLTDKKSVILNGSDYKGDLDERAQKELDDIDLRISLLANPEISEDPVNFTEEELKSKTEEELYNISINNAQLSIKLRNYIKNKRDIKEQYIDIEEKEGFEKQLNTNIEIVKRWEAKDPITNKNTRSEKELAKIPEYVRAKNWITKNTYKIYDYNDASKLIKNNDEVYNLLEAYYRGEITESHEDFNKVLAAAIIYFGSRNGEELDKKSDTKQILNRKGVKDSNHVPDGRQLTEDDLKKIKEEQEFKFSSSRNGAYSTTSIIHNNSGETTAYTSEFYNKMQGGGLVDNVAYMKVIHDINEILRTCYDSDTKVLDTSKLTIEELNNVADLFEKIGFDSDGKFEVKNGIKKYLVYSKPKSEKAKQFIEENVEFILSDQDKAEFEKQRMYAARNGEDTEVYKAWCRINYELDEFGNQIPNHLLWGNAKPKDAVKDKYIDKRKTAAIRLINKMFDRTATIYYEEKLREMVNATPEEYKTWYEANHYYNPVTRRMEPLPCWTVSVPTDIIKYHYEPTYNMSKEVPKEQYKNKFYKENIGLKRNYKTKEQRVELQNDEKYRANPEVYVDTISDGSYDNNLNLNEYEQKTKELVENLLTQLCSKNGKARRWNNAGNLPMRAKQDKTVTVKKACIELAKSLGVYDFNKDIYYGDDAEISYDIDYVPTIPMSERLTSKDSVKKPIRERFDKGTKGDIEYQKALEEYENNLEQIQKTNEEIHQQLLDKNYSDVIAQFITEMSHFNAIQDNKHILMFGQKLIRDIEVYKTKKADHGQLVKDRNSEEDNDNIYSTEKDTNLIHQYDNWIRRLVYNQFKENQGALTKFAGVIQGFTSTSYMTLNVRGGIANITVGETNILQEVFAKQFFGVNEWLGGKRIWTSGIGSYFAHMYDEDAGCLADAIIKAFQCVDYDEVNGRIEQLDMNVAMKRLRDLGFSPNNIGEHMMQNSVMFSLMLSHRVIANPKYGEPGETKYIIVNLGEYQNMNRDIVFKSICTPEQRAAFDKYVNSIKKDKNKLKDYAWFKYEVYASFMASKQFTDEQRRQFKEKIKELNSESEKQFDKEDNLYSQFDISANGKMIFKAGSKLEECSKLNDSDIESGKEVSDAYKLMGLFKNRVLSVNKYIHGNYGKMDAAEIEKYALGRLIMQYHKHIPIGILKRYRREGYYNEAKGIVEKGSIVSLIHFLKMPIDLIKNDYNLNDKETETLKGVQKIIENVNNYVTYLKAYSKVLPDYEVANMKRNLGDLAAILVAVATAIGIRIVWDDDDDSFAFNLLAYETDRLASECGVWTIGMFSEAKKLWSSPVAAESIFEDVLSTANVIVESIFEGEDYNPYFSTGRYAGQKKWQVYVERRIPYWRNIAALRDISDNNSYYKLSENMLGILNVKHIAKSLKE